MKRIIIANDLLIGGGVENVLENLVRYLMRQGNEITLMLPDHTEEVQKIFGNDVKIYPMIRSLKKIKKYSLQWFWDRGLYVLQKQIYRIRFFFQQYDVLIALKEGAIMKEVAGLYAKKKFAWVHADYNFMHWTKGYFHSDEDERKCMMKYDKVACVSEATRCSLIHTIGNPGNLCVKYNPIDYAKIRVNALETCPERKSSEGILYVSIGRLDYPKNYSLLLDVCNELTKHYPFELWIVGDGPERKELQEKIDSYGLNCVKLLGSKKNPFPYLEQADVFISTSMVESYGLAVQEALILGKPVIAVKCPAIEENFDKHFGLLTEATYQSIKNAMECFLSAPEEIIRYRTEIREHYKTDDLFETRLTEIERLWEI